MRAALAALLGLAASFPALAQTLVVGVTEGERLELDAGAAFDRVEIREGAVLALRGPLTVAGDLVVRGGGRLTAADLAPADGGWAELRLSVDGGFIVEARGVVDVAGGGLAAGLTIDPARGVATRAVIPTTAGGSHFARGGGGEDAVSYDEPAAPRFPGAGSGTESGGSRGGGLLHVTARRVTLDGLVTADGQSGRLEHQPGGAGGTVSLTAERFEGAGGLSAIGGTGGCYVSGGAGGLVRVAAASTGYTGTLSVRGGLRDTRCFGQSSGAAGAALFVDRATGAGRAVAGEYPLRGVDRFDAFEVAAAASARVSGAAEVLQPVRVEPGATLTLASVHALDRLTIASPLTGTARVDVAAAAPSLDLVVGAGGTLAVNQRLTLRSLIVEPGALVTHDARVATMALEATRSIEVRRGARVDASGRGLWPRQTIVPSTGQVVTGDYDENGGSHGGLGGRSSTSTKPPPPIYDDPEAPAYPGGGGGVITYDRGLPDAAAGGGVVRLQAPLLRVDGVVAANGNEDTAWRWAGGAGGSIVLRAGTLTGAGEIAANGGAWPEVAGRSKAGGGGGLVLIESATDTFTGVASVEGGFGEVRGGAGRVTRRSVELAPRIVTEPPTRATAGHPVAYAPLATGTAPITWALVAGPTDATLDERTGRLDWTPRELGRADFTLVATNTLGRDEQAFSLLVELTTSGGGWSDGGARAPAFASTPDTAATCGVPYRYSGAGRPVVDGEGPLTFGLEPLLGVPPPAGMSIDAATGELRWTPTRADVGAHPVELVVRGPSGVAGQRLAIVVSCPAPTELTSCGCGAAGGVAATGATAFATLLALGGQRRRRRSGTGRGRGR